MTAPSPPAPARRFTPTWSTLALVAGVALAVASIVVEPAKEPTQEVIGSTDAPTELTADGSPVEQAAGPDGSTQTEAGGPAAAQQGVVSKPGLACAAGKNGANTDTGVTGNSIKLGATVVESGIGASFLGDVRHAMRAVVDKTNRTGGICGRQIQLKLVDDGWDYNRGGEYIRNLIEDEKVFALAVVPSSEGLRNVSDGGDLKKHGIPVVGSDGMLFHQYTDPWIWPVATSTVSTMHIMAKQAHDAGAKEFGIVYESTYHFGIEGAYAFNAAVKRLTGSDIDGYSDPLKNPKCEAKFCGITAGQPSYTSQIQTFSSACNNQSTGGCPFVAMLLEPATALTWMKGGGPRPEPNRRMGGPQPLFTYDFANSCGQPCDQLWLWTGYNPPLGDYLGRPAVSTYVNDIKAASSAADFNNSFVEGGYIGMSLMVKALQAVGPNLTRTNLKAVLDGMTFDPGLTSSPLSWKAGNHFANIRAQAFSIQYKSGFAGWRDERVSLDDPWVGQDGAR